MDFATGDTTTTPRVEEDRRFRAAFDNAVIGMALASESGHLITTNASFCEMLGFEPGGLDGRHFSEFTHPDDIASSAEHIDRLISGPVDAVQLEKRYLHREGTVVWARLSLARVIGGYGRPNEIVAQIEDVTAQRTAAAEAAASEERFRLTFESAASGMALVDPTNGRFIRVNPAGCAMLGYTEGELQGLAIQDVTAPGDRAESTERFRAVITGEEASSRAKLHYLRADGSTAYGIVSTALARDIQGRPLHLVANVVDITEQVEAQDQLQDLVASKDRLIASVSHELRTPLTAVLGFAELLRVELDRLSAPERVELVESIAQQTGDLAQIVEDLLVAARSEDQSLVVVSVPVDLRAQAAQVIEALGHQTRVAIEIDGGPIQALGDPARVRQILRNLISNAFRYGGDNVVVRVYQRDSRACIAVVDDGVGVPVEDRIRIFEPYQRARGQEERADSIGLGLTVSRRLAQLMEGDLGYDYRDGTSVFELEMKSAKRQG